MCKHIFSLSIIDTPCKLIVNTFLKFHVANRYFKRLICNESVNCGNEQNANYIVKQKLWLIVFKWFICKENDSYWIKNSCAPFVWMKLCHRKIYTFMWSAW